MLRPQELLATALLGAGKVALVGVLVHVAPQLAGCGEGPLTALHLALERPLPSVAQHVLLQATHLVKLAAAALKVAGQVLVLGMHTLMGTHAGAGDKAPATARVGAAVARGKIHTILQQHLYLKRMWGVKRINSALIIWQCNKHSSMKPFVRFLCFQRSSKYEFLSPYLRKVV